MDKTKGHTRIQTQSQTSSQTQTPARHGVVKQGILWQQSDKLFSKWKERYFILTRDHLCCLKKGEGGFTCGETVSKIRLDDIKSIELATRITHQTIELTLGGENQGNRILLKSNGNLREWFDVLNACCNIAKQRKNPQSGYIEAVKARGRNLRREKTEIRQTDGMRFINLSDHLPRFSFRGVSNSLQKPRPRSNSASPYGPLAGLDSSTQNGFAQRTPGGSLRSKLRNYDKIYRTRNGDTTTDKNDEGQELSENVCYRISRPQSSVPSPPPRNN